MAKITAEIMKKKNKDEAALEDECCRWARGLGLAAVKLEKNGNKGIPDRAIIAPGGRTLYVELKRPDGRGVVSDEQAFWSRFLGGGGVIVDNEVDFKRAIMDFFSHELIMMVGGGSGDVRVKTF